VSAPATIDEYIAAFSPDVQQVLQRICETVKGAAPTAVERISYGMPTFALRKVIVHFGAFNDHIGLYPPVRNPELQTKVRPYQGEKGNLRFKLDEPIHYALIAEIVAARVAAP